MKYYIYEHIREDLNTPFYVGKGSGNRCFSKQRSKKWKEITSKVNYKVNIIAKYNNENVALEVERKLQLKYENQGIELCNLTICGLKGTYNYHHTKEAKIKISNKTKELWKNEKFRSIIKPKLKGLNNGFSDKSIYNFYHSIYREISCTQYELRNKYNLSNSHLSQIVNNKRLSHKGWKLLTNKNINPKREDNKIYNWYHSIHGVIKKRKLDLLKTYSNLNQPNLCKLIKGIQKSHKGWIII